jgi:FkbM family methyltransferase
VLRAKGKCNVEGHLFEISDKTIKILMENQNLKLPNIVINNLALSDSSGETRFLDYGAGSGVNTLLVDKPFHDIPASTARVFSITGDYYLNAKKIERVNLCKIDVEGFEASVLRGFEKSLNSHLLEVIQFEYGFLSPASGGLLNQLYEIFEKNGYKVGRLTQNGVDFREFKWIHNDFRSGPNYVACLPKLVSSLEKF